jgi:hypothetical protein
LVSQETKLPKTYQAQCLCSYWLKRAERQVSSKLASRLKMWGIIGSEWAAFEMYRPSRTSSVGCTSNTGAAWTLLCQIFLE